jgi:PAS domain S-box-containing protein
MAASVARQKALKFEANLSPSKLPGPLARAADLAVIATDLDRRIVYWNGGAEELYGWSEAEALGRDILRVTAFESGDAEQVLATVEKGKSRNGKSRVRRRNGEAFTAFISIEALHDESGTPVGVVGLSCAVDDGRGKPRNALQSLNERFTRIVGRTVDEEPSALLQLGIVLGAVAGATLLRLLLGQYFGNVPRFNLYFPAILLAGLLGGWRAGVATSILSAALSFSVFLTPQLGFRGASRSQIVGLVLSLLSAAVIVAVAHWVRTLMRMLRQKHAELAARNFQYNTLFDAMNEGFALCEGIRDESGRLVDYVLVEINPALQNMLGVGPEVAGGRLSDGPGDHSQWLRVCDRVLRTGTPWKYTSHNAATGRWHDIHIDRVGSNRISQFFFDITERKEAEERQVQLFAELNHRVKNNFAVVSGFLRMQARGAADPALREELMKAVNRVQGIADIHSSLYRSGRTKDIEFGDYVKDLCERLAQSLLDNDRIRLDVNAEAADLPLDSAIALGMIVNELVTNAAKHAYPPPSRGVISIRFMRDGSDYVLTIQDQGCGLATDPEARSKGLGMKLVPALAAQVSATLTIREEAGLFYELRVPIAAIETARESAEAMEG